jgi:hypothetical protein
MYIFRGSIGSQMFQAGSLAPATAGTAETYITSITQSNELHVIHVACGGLQVQEMVFAALQTTLFSPASFGVVPMCVLLTRCAQVARFPRYTKPAKLLETRKGRWVRRLWAHIVCGS